MDQTFDLATRAGAAAFLEAKVAWSLANDVVMSFRPRLALPVVTSPNEAATYVARLPYTGDPRLFGIPGTEGAGDFYEHPERISAALEAGTADQERIDCDDFAGIAYLMLRQIPGCKTTVVTILDESGKFGHHVICTYTFNGAKGVIDTNGHHLLPDLAESTICRLFSDIYVSLGYRYFAALDSPYPF